MQKKTKRQSHRLPAVETGWRVAGASRAICHKILSLHEKYWYLPLMVTPSPFPEFPKTGINWNLFKNRCNFSRSASFFSSSIFFIFFLSRGAAGLVCAPLPPTEVAAQKNVRTCVRNFRQVRSKNVVQKSRRSLWLVSLWIPMRDRTP